MVSLADEYHLPVHELLERWTSREISEQMVSRKRKLDREQEAIDAAKKPAAKTRELTPEEILALLDADRIERRKPS